MTEEAKDILQEVFNVGIGKAAVSFSEILDREINLSFPTLLMFNWEQLQQYLEEKELTEYVAVSQGFSGGLSGKGVISFPLTDGKTLVNRLLENPDSNDPDFGTMERETVMEVGNILINAVACSISDMLEIETQYEMPEVHIADGVMKFEEDTGDNIYCLGQGNLAVEGIEIQGMMLFILTYNGIETIINALSYS